MHTDDIWQDKVAIVTGGSSGIGKATALELVKRGGKVLITGRDPEKIKDMAALSEAIVGVQMDSADTESGNKIVAAAFEAWGRIDLVVNNSGAGGLFPVENYQAGAIEQMSAVNIIAPSLLVSAASESLRETKGAVVNIGTAVSQNAAPLLAHYGATKAALEHLTRSWAVELAPHGIRVNAISPGPVKSGALTGMMGLSEEMAQTIEAQEAEQVPLGRRGTPEDIVPWILRLGSAENAWLTGQVLTVDGGWSLRS